MNFNNEHRTGSSTRPNYFAEGGIVQQGIARTVNSSSSTKLGIDYELLASMIGQRVGEANMNLPSPVVAVEDIRTGVDNQVEVEDGANI